jgi:hypothetical protein
MALFLKENEVCPYAFKCPHGTNCYGARSDRPNTFDCDLVSADGTINELGHRNPLDQTGKMNVLMESSHG